jgi:hypothetical protein
MTDELTDELITNADGELVPRSSIVSGGAARPKPLQRSWGKKDGYSGKFDYEGATIYIRLLDESAWNEIEDEEEALQEDSEKLTLSQQAIEDNIALDDDHEGKWDAATLKARRKEYRRHSMEIADRMFAFQRSIVERTVMGWKDAPVEYSPEALRTILDNEREMVVEWAGVILEKSRLGVADSKNSRRR